MNYTISEERIHKLTKGWKVVDGKLYKKFNLENYGEVMDLANEIAKIAEKQNHHPDMILRYNTLEVTMFDHEKNKISEKCYKFIKAVNDI